MEMCELAPVGSEAVVPIDWLPVNNLASVKQNSRPFS
jgi:hypothetical protein